MSHSSKPLALLLVLLGAASVTGCGPDYEQTQITGVVQSPLGGRVDHGRVEVPEGMIVKAHMVPLDDDGDPMTTTMRVRNPEVIEAAGVVSDSDYAFLGLRPGVTQIEFRADGRIVMLLDAVVTPQTHTP